MQILRIFIGAVNILFAIASVFPFFKAWKSGNKKMWSYLVVYGLFSLNGALVLI